MNRIFLVLVIFAVSFPAIAAEPDKSDGLITFGGSSFSGISEKAWMKRPIELRKKVEHFLLMDMGLSSTGGINLIGVYYHNGPAANQQTFHFQQVDLGGERLFWSVLISPDTMQARILYNVSETKTKAEWVKIE